MTPSRRPEGAGPSLGGGVWVLIVAGLLVTLAVILHTVASLRQQGPPLSGDGRNVSSYGFDLVPLVVSPDEVIASGAAKDAIRALVDPTSWTLSELARHSLSRRGKLLLPSDRVVGVSVSGRSRAYPLRILSWHEVVNDTLGGEAIAVTYNPLCDSVVVFHRTVAGEVLEFGVSGLLYNSNLLMFDRRPDPPAESLWSQLGMRAISGPAATRRERLDILHCAVLPWHEWLAAHPDTSVLAPDARLSHEYRRDPYSSYFGSDLLRFPVHLPPTAPPLPPKTPVIAFPLGERGTFAITFPEVAAHAAATGIWRTQIGGESVVLRYSSSPETVWVQPAPGAPPPAVAYSFSFAWSAIRGVATTWIGE